MGQPILLAFVETGSMSPSLNANDGFIAVPQQLSDSPETGDVVTYSAETIQGGGLTTHRIVGKANRGYVTKGDANPFTDQEANEPPVKERQIVAKALEVNGRIVVIPGVGNVVGALQSVLSVLQRSLAALVGSRSLLGAQGMAYLFFIITLFWYAAGEILGRNSKRRRRDTSRVTGTDARLVIGAFAALLVVGATVAMVAPAGTHEYRIVSANFDSERPDVISAGESKNRSYVLDNGGVFPVIAFLESSSKGVQVKPQESVIPARSALNASLTIHAPEETGQYRRYVTEHRYLAVLPESMIRALHEVHPWLPIVLIDALIAVPFYLLGVRLVGESRIRRRSRESTNSIVSRVWGFVTDCY